MSGPERFVDWAQHWQYWLVRGVFVVAVLAEVLRPERARLFSLAWRWTTNVGLHFINGWALRIVAPYAVASWLTATLGPPQVSVLKPIEAWGGPWAVLVGAFVLLDLTTYFLHRLEHGVFVLWRVHSVHHADADVDATTAVRHHPFEVLFMGASLPLFMLVLGIPT